MRLVLPNMVAHGHQQVRFPMPVGPQMNRGLYPSVPGCSAILNEAACNAEDAYVKQAKAIGDVRRAKQLRFTETALGLLAFSSLCGLVIFITAPTRQS